MSRRTVLHVLEASGFGTGRHLTDLVGATPEVDHVAVLAPRRIRRGDPPTSGTAGRLRELGARVVEVPMRRLPLHPVNARAAARVRDLTRTLRPDVVHGHASVGGALARLATRGLPVRRLYTPHALLPSRVAMAAERVLAPTGDLVVALSPSEADQVVALGLAERDDVRVIPNGLDLSRPVGAPTADLRARFALGDVPVVGFVGRLAPQKAPEHAVQAVARLVADVPDVHLVMLATGPQLAMTERLVDDLGITGRVHLAGFVPGADTLLDQFDVLLSPSRWEGGPYVPLEGMRVGVPVVLSDCVGNREVVEPGVSGERAAVGDVEGFATALARVLADARHADGVVQAAHHRLRERFDLAVTSRAYLEAWGA